MEMTRGQKNYITFNFYQKFAGYDMSKEAAIKFIGSDHTIFRQHSDPVARRFAREQNVQEFIKTLPKASCSNCHKPTEPINTQETCSC